MIPIYEQGKGKGIGLDLDSFIKRFDSICKEHIRNKQAKAFAFIFYDFTNQDLRRILRDQGVIVKLDRLSGTDLSLFYLHTGTQQTTQKFNEYFLTALGIENAATPCVSFFRINGDSVEDVAVAQLDHTNLIHGFNELHGVIKKYIGEDKSRLGEGLSALKWLKRGGGFLSIEALRAALTRAFESLF